MNASGPKSFANRSVAEMQPPPEPVESVQDMTTPDGVGLRLYRISLRFQARQECRNSSVAERPIIRTVTRVVYGRAFSFG